MIMDHPPLVSFNIQFSFKTMDSISIEQLYELSKKLEPNYSISPKLVLLQSMPQTRVKFQLPPSSMEFKTENAILRLFSDRIVFIIQEYRSWTDTLEEIISILIDIIEILGVQEFKLSRIEYINEFIFDKEEFKIDTYFTLFPRYNDRWELNYSDFHLGVKLFIEEGDVFVIRLRGVQSKNESKYRILLESFFRASDIYYSINDVELLKQNLESAHSEINKHFYEILTPQLKIFLGVHED